MILVFWMLSFNPTYLFNLYAECIIQNAGLDKAQAGIKILGRNINNLRYTDETTLMAESDESMYSHFQRALSWTGP